MFGAPLKAASALKSFVERVKNGDVPAGSYLLVELLIKLSREDVPTALRFFLELLELGLTIVTIGDEERVYSEVSVAKDFSQLLMSIVVMMRSHNESALKSHRVSEAWGNKRARARDAGQAMTSRCPGWLRLVGGPRDGR